MSRRRVLYTSPAGCTAGRRSSAACSASSTDSGSPASCADLREYRSALRVLNDALAAAAGGRTIVDSSKAPLHGLLLAGVQGLDVRTVQLVRDPRGSLHSRLKRNRGRAAAARWPSR